MIVSLCPICMGRGNCGKSSCMMSRQKDWRAPMVNFSKSISYTLTDKDVVLAGLEDFVGVQDSDWEFALGIY